VLEIEPYKKIKLKPGKSPLPLSLTSKENGS